MHLNTVPWRLHFHTCNISWVWHLSRPILLAIFASHWQVLHVYSHRLKHFRDTRSNILDLVPFNEILCCLVNGELLKAKFLLFLSLFEVLSSRKFQLCDLSAIQSNNSGGHFVFCSMTSAQAQNAWDGGLHIKCHTKNKKTTTKNGAET